jgi:putative heme transporter
VADEIAALKSGRNLRQVARYVLGAGLGICVLVLLFGRRGELVSAWAQLGHVAAGWVVAALASEGLSLWAFAYLQRRVLGLAGATIPMPALFLLTLANDAIANTVPGEPAVSSAYRYRYYRRRGASGASAGWTIFTILIAQAIGMALLLLLGVVVALGASPSARNARAALAGLVIIAAAVAILLRRDLVLRLGVAVIWTARRMTGHPRGNVGARISAALARMREIPLGVRSTAGVVAIATVVWGCDFGCLLCAFGAVRAAIPWNGVLLAYGVAVVAGTLPFVPGGIGVVEGSLAVILAAYGASQTQALSAALVFRMVSFWLAVAVGWISVAVIARQARGPGVRVTLGAIPAGTAGTRSWYGRRPACGAAPFRTAGNAASAGP